MARVLPAISAQPEQHLVFVSVRVVSWLSLVSTGKRITKEYEMTQIREFLFWVSTRVALIASDTQATQT